MFKPPVMNPTHASSESGRESWGAPVPGVAAHHGRLRNRIALPVDRDRPVDPSTVTFIKSNYPAASEVVQACAAGDSHSGQWFIVLRCRSKAKSNFMTKRVIGRAGGGFYATKAAAEADVFSTRMRFEGFVERGGNWYAPRSIPADADVPVVQPPDAAAHRSAVGPVVLGRLPASAAKRPHPAGEDGRGAADDDKAKDHMYLKKSQKRGGPRKRKDCRRYSFTSASCSSLSSIPKPRAPVVKPDTMSETPVFGVR